MMFVASHKHENLKGLISQGGPLHLQDFLAEGACVMYQTSHPPNSPLCLLQLPPHLSSSCRPLPATP
jgi:hypothetical protein